MSDLVLTLTPEAQQRLEALAVRLDRSVDDCLQLAVIEFMDHWEDYLQTLAEIDIDIESGEKGPVLRAANE